MTHQARVSRTLADFEGAMSRLVDRASTASAAEGVRVPPDGGWTVAGIIWHVATTNHGFADMVDGTRPLAEAPAAGFIETPFSEITALLPPKLEAPDVFEPPADITLADAMERLLASRRRFHDVYGHLPESRGMWTIDSFLGPVTVYQVGDWAAAHVARHNAQVKRTLGR